MPLRIEVDDKLVLQQLAAVGANVRRELARGLERIANAAQQDERTGMRARFTIAPSRQSFLRNMIKRNREDRATAAHLAAIVRLEGPRTDPSRADLLARHEEGGTHHDTGLFFIPSRAIRPTATALPPRNLYPKALRLMDARGIGGATGSILTGGLKGKRRKIAGVDASVAKLRKVGLGGTFLIRGADGRASIYQRQGEGRDGLVKLWSLVPTVRLPRRLAFFDTIEQTVDRTWRQHLDRAVTDALP